MSAIGYYRVKFSELTGNIPVNLYIDGVWASTKYIEHIELCENGRLLKYIDKNGQYRFWGFNEFYEERVNAESLGFKSELITSILTDHSDERDMGNKYNDEIDLIAENVTTKQLLILSQINYSPRVYLYIGDGTDYSDKSWLLVKITKKDPLKKRSKNEFGTFEITIQLPTNKGIGEL